MVSCKKGDSATWIEVQFPSAGATYQVPDSVNVRLIVTDTELTNLEVKIVGPEIFWHPALHSIDLEIDLTP